MAEKTLIDKVEASGIAILLVGVVFLAFTFLNAYWFLTEKLDIIASSDLINAFGEALAPLIATCIRVMYLGVMGWVGSMLTTRGISLIKHTKPKPPAATPPQVQAEAKAAEKEEGKKKRERAGEKSSTPRK